MSNFIFKINDVFKRNRYGRPQLLLDLFFFSFFMQFSVNILPRVVNPGSTTENVTQPNSGHVFGVNEFIFTLVTRKTNFLLQADISLYLFSQIKLVTTDNVLPYYA